MKPRRLARLNSLIKERVATLILQDLKDPRIGFVTVLRVDVTRDCQFANIYISILGSESQKNATMRALEHSAGHISCEVGKILEIRNTPRCRFHLDESIQQQIHFDKLLQSVLPESLPDDPAQEDSKE